MVESINRPSAEDSASLRTYRYGTDAMKLTLTPLAVIAMCGLDGRFGALFSVLCRFVSPMFFILCGYFVLGISDDKERADKLRRAMLRSGRYFGLLFIVYLAVNFVLLTALNFNSLEGLWDRRVLFNFVVLNLWPAAFPIGNSIWFIQSLFYAYVILNLVNLAGLLRFYKPVMIVLLLVMLVMGEFSGLLGISWLGYPYIPGNWLTRALPYMLVGLFLAEHRDFFLKFKVWQYAAVFALGLALALAEGFLLSAVGRMIYDGHLIGFGLMALAACCFGLTRHGKVRWDSPLSWLFLARGRDTTRRIYFLAQPICFLIRFMLLLHDHSLAAAYSVIPAYLISFLIAVAIPIRKSSRGFQSLKVEDW